MGTTAPPTPWQRLRSVTSGRRQIRSRTRASYSGDDGGGHRSDRGGGSCDGQGNEPPPIVTGAAVTTAPAVHV